MSERTKFAIILITMGIIGLSIWIYFFLKRGFETPDDPVYGQSFAIFDKIRNIVVLVLSIFILVMGVIMLFDI
jgi:hypothetical protein